MAFPDLKGQAPLRPVEVGTGAGLISQLFLTSKVRLHCDVAAFAVDQDCAAGAFPDLKGQAPLRPGMR